MCALQQVKHELQQVIRERELKRVFEKEVTKLKETVATQKIYALNLEKKVKDLQGNLSGVQKMKDENIHGLATEKSSMGQKIKQLINEVEERDEIIEDLRYKLQAKEELQARIEEERRKQLRDMNSEVTEENEKKMYKITKLVGELADMSQKFSESEYMRKKYIEKNKDLDRKLKEQSESMYGLMEQLEKVKKETSSLRKAKSTNHKILDKKIAELEQCVQERNKTIL